VRRLAIGAIAGLIAIWTVFWGIAFVAAYASPSWDWAPVFGIAIGAGLLALLGLAGLVVFVLISLPARRVCPVREVPVTARRTSCPTCGHELGGAAG